MTALAASTQEKTMTTSITTLEYINLPPRNSLTSVLSPGALRARTPQVVTESDPPHQLVKGESQEQLIDKPHEPTIVVEPVPASRRLSRSLGVTVLLLSVIMILGELAILGMNIYSVVNYIQYSLYQTGDAYIAMFTIFIANLGVCTCFILLGCLGILSVLIKSRKAQFALSISYGIGLLVLMCAQLAITIVPLVFGNGLLTVVFGILTGVVVVVFILMAALAFARAFVIKREDSHPIVKDISV
jgi:hypothetical protein